MSDDQRFGFTQNMPALAGIYKMALFDFLLDEGLVPSDEDILPQPRQLVCVKSETDEFAHSNHLCLKCANSLYESALLEGDVSAHILYSEDHADRRDTAFTCDTCSTILDTNLTRKGCKSVVVWTRNASTEDQDLSHNDWLELWLAARALKTDDHLWDDIWIVLDHYNII